MAQSQQEEKKKGVLDRLPKIGRASQLVLILIIFVAILVALWAINEKLLETTKDNLTNTLNNLQKIVGVGVTPKAKYEAELLQIKAETEAARAVFPTTTQAPEIMDTLLQLAEDNDLSVIQTKISMPPPPAKGKTATTADIPIGPILSIELALKGQIPKFQNFLLGLDSKLPTAQIKSLSFSTPT